MAIGSLLRESGFYRDARVGVATCHQVRANPVSRCLALLCRGVLLAVLTPIPSAAQSASMPSTNGSASTPTSPPLPSDYVIGVDDVISVVFWKESDLSAEVVVRPDGKISLPMLNDVQAAGLRPEQLAEIVERSASKFVRDPNATVMVKAIHSRKIYVIGEVTKPGKFTLANEMNVLQAIAEAGGFLEHANKGDVVIVRRESGHEQRFKFNYNDVVRGRNTEQNIKLLPGDTILVR
jgi:polysaccharide export outer membrane protein